MLLTVNRKVSTEIKDEVVRKILGIYPEEDLVNRQVFKDAFSKGTLEVKFLKSECDKISLPWQMFLLDELALNGELKRIDTFRQKVSDKLFVKRKGGGNTTSRRILDRMIRSQNYISENGSLGKNVFNASLKGMKTVDAVAHIQDFFGIDMLIFRRKSKADALDYLISKFEDKAINVCRGVLTNKILPELSESRDVYKSTSGFAIKDEKIPFIFIPSEVNPDEVDGRQIFTLVYLITLIGLDTYGYFIGKDFKASLLNAKGAEKFAYAVASEFLLPRVHTEKYRGTKITEEIRDSLSSGYKITPSAVVVILKLRGFFATQAEYESLMPLPVASKKKRSGGSKVAIEKSVRKFSGKHAFDFINGAIKGNKIFPVPAQYLIFGCVNKKRFREYRKNLSI